MDDESLLHSLRELNGTAEFNRWVGLEVASASLGEVELVLAWRADFGQYAGFLHAGLAGTLIDTACGFAAFTTVGGVLAANLSVNFLAPAVGDRFVAQARVVKQGRTLVFTSAELFADSPQGRRLVATGETLLVRVAA